MKSLLKTFFFSLAALFISGAIFEIARSENVWFYYLTALFSILAVWGYFKKSKLIFMLAAPGVLRMMIYFTTSTEFSFFDILLHSLGTLFPLGISFFLNRDHLLKEVIKLSLWLLMHIVGLFFLSVAWKIAWDGFKDHSNSTHVIFPREYVIITFVIIFIFGGLFSWFGFIKSKRILKDFFNNAAPLYHKSGGT